MTTDTTERADKNETKRGSLNLSRGEGKEFDNRSQKSEAGADAEEE